jgi:hypothetical protein
MDTRSSLWVHVVPAMQPRITKHRKQSRAAGKGLEGEDGRYVLCTARFNDDSCAGVISPNGSARGS